MAKAASKRGGSRPGAGRPKDSRNTLEYGEVAAIAAAKLRIPEDADPAVKQVAARAFMRLVHVMEEQVPEWNARNVLSAATRIREEACGPLAQKVEHRVHLESLTDEELEAKWHAIQEKLGAETKGSAE